MKDSDGLQLIVGHLNADFDTIGAMIGVSLIYKDATILLPDSLEDGVRRFLKSELMERFEFTSYKNLPKHPVERIILVDTRQKGRLGKVEELFSEDMRGFELHIFDHHQPSKDDLKGDVEFIWEVGATSTIITEILCQRRIEIPKDVATLLLLGIYEDTGFLTFPSTRDRDFFASATLLNSGGDLKLVAKLLDRGLKLEQVGLMNQAIENLSILTIMGQSLAISSATVENYIPDVAVIVQKLKVMIDVPTLFFLCRMKDRIYVIGRSDKDGINVGRVLEEMGGGGHATAASVVIRGMTLNEVKNLLLKSYESVAGGSTMGRARDIMFYPVITIEKDRTIGEAVRIMILHAINSLPVVNEGKVIGLLTRQTIEKAGYQGYKERKVTDFCITEFGEVHPDTPLCDILKLIRESNQKFIPVIENGILKGGITRTEVFKYYYTSSEDKIGMINERKGFSGGRRVVPFKKSVLHQMEMSLPKEIVSILKRAGEFAEEDGLKAYLVGGVVRDILLNRRNLDIDIVLEGEMEEIERYARRLSQEFSLPLHLHREFRTASLYSNSNFRIDLAGARMEIYERFASLPKVMKGSLKADLDRRDFTINSLAIALNPSEFGIMLDYYNGERDTKDRVIRVLHSLSFLDDPTRILRAIRFEQRFGFRIGEQTMKFMQNALNAGILDRLSSTRLLHEFILMCKEDDPARAFIRCDELGINRALGFGNIDLKRRETLQRVREAIEIVKLSREGIRLEEWLIYMMCLLHGQKSEEIEAVLARFGIKGKKNETIVRTLNNAGGVLKRLSTDGVKNSTIYRILSPFPFESLILFFSLEKEEKTRRRIYKYLTVLKDIEPLLKGHHLKEEGIEEGPIYSKLLKDAFDRQLDGELKDKEEAKRYLQKISKRLKEGHSPWKTIR